MVEKVKNSKTHWKSIPTDAYCCLLLGVDDEGRRPNFSLWAEFLLIPLMNHKNLIGKKTEM
jgi:hypothetical protein